MRAPVVILVGLAIGCAPSWEDPIVSVESFQVRQIGLSGADVDTVLSMYNPNTEPLPFEQVRYEIRIGDSGPVSGTATFDRPLPPLESVSVPSQLRVPAASALSIGRELAAGRRDYHLKGIMTLQYRGRRDVDFEREGELDAFGAPPSTGRP